MNKTMRFFKATSHSNLIRLVAGFVFGIVLFFSPISLFANPDGGQVSAGSATINHSENTVTIQQHSNKAVIDWQSYNIQSHETTRYVQPSRNSIALNRINPRNGASTIAGKLSANGHVWLINPAGILFTSTARVDVGGILATTANISNDDFMKGNYHFKQSPDWNGAVINEGTITVADEGVAALVAPGVENRGVIRANLGKVALAASNEYTVDFYGDSLINFAVGSEVNQAAIDSEGRVLKQAVSNSGSIFANGGSVLIAAKTANKVLDNTINMSGYVEAKTAVQKGGSIILMGGDNSNVTVSGKMIASGKSAGQKGGKVKVLGKHIKLVEKAEIDVSGDQGGGEILIGGNAHGAGPEPNAATTFLGKDVKLNADALTRGNGGKVIAWADDITQFYGMISARGGELGGNGGFVETSGKNWLHIVGGKVDASAVAGTSGQWLLDPRNVTISTTTTNGSFDGGDPNTFTPTGNNANVDVTTINTALDGGTSVTINTGSTGGQPGNITVSSAILKSAGLTTPTLTLDAAGSILVNNNITASSGGLNVMFISGNAITIGNASDATITTNGGNFTATSQNAFNFGSGGNQGILNVGLGTVSISANQDGAGTQSFAMNTGSSITSTNTGSSAVNISVNTTGGGTGSAALSDITVGSGGTITITTNSAGNDITQASGTLDSGTGTVTLSTATTSGRNIGTSGAPVIIKAGTVNATTGNNGIFITNTGTSALDLGTINTTGEFTLTSNSSSGITDSGTLTVSDTITLDTSTTQNITLNSPSNNFGTLAVTSGNNVSVIDTDALILGTSTVSGTYDITAGGSITQSGVLTISGTPTFTVTAASSDISLENQVNNFSTTPVFTNNGNIRDLGLYNTAATASVPTLPTGMRNLTLTFDNAAMTLPPVSLTGDLTVTAGGLISQSGALTSSSSTSAITAKTINDAGSAITLNDSGNDFARVLLQSRNTADSANASGTLTYRNLNGFDLRTLHTTGDANLTAGGNITDSTTAGAIVGGTTTIDAGTNNITLNTATNDFNTVVITSSNNVTLVDANALIMGASTIGGTLSLTTSGSITQSGALTVSGTTTLTPGAANDITFDNVGNDFSTIRAVNGNNVSFVDTNALILGASTVSGTFNVTAGGDITDSDGSTIGGIASFTAGSGNNITLDRSDNDFNVVTVISGNDVNFRDANALVLDAITASGTLTIRTAGALTQTAAISATGATSLRADGPNDITLTNAGNNFSSVGIVVGNNVSLVDSNALELSTSTVSGTLDVTAGGTISQTGALTVTGTPTFTVSAANSDILLATSANNFTVTPVFTNNGNIRDLALRNTDAAASVPTLPTGLRNLTLIFNNAAIAFPALTVTGSLTATADGDISQTDSLVALVVPGILTLDAGAANNIILNNASNNFGTVAITTGNDVTLQDINALDLGTSTVSGVFNVTSNGAITQTGTVDITGITTLATGNANDITLSTATNDFSTVAITSGNNVTLRDTNAIVLGASSVANNLTVTATSITQSGILSGNKLTAKTLNNAGGAITLNTVANDFTTINLQSRNGADTSNDTGTIAYQDSNGFDIEAIATANTGTSALSLNANGNITDSGSLTVSGTTTIATGISNNIILDDSANNFGTMSITSANNVTIVDTNALILGNTSINGALNVTTNGAITDSGTLSIADTATFAAGSANSITLNSAANDFSTISVTSANNATFVDANALNLEAITVANNLSVTVTGNLLVDGILEAGGSVSLLGNTGNGNIIITQSPLITGSGSLTILPAGTGVIQVGGSLATNGGFMTLGALTMTADLSLSTASGDLTLSTLSGPYNLTLNTGSAGDLTFNGNLNTNLLTVLNTHDLTNNATMNVTGGYQQNAGNISNFGTSTLNVFDGNANITSNSISGNINITNGNATTNSNTFNTTLTVTNGNATITSGTIDSVINTTGNTTLIGQNAFGTVNVGSLSLALTGDVILQGTIGGSKGAAAVSKIVFLTQPLRFQFFNGIDLWVATEIARANANPLTAQNTLLPLVSSSPLATINNSPLSITIKPAASKSSTQARSAAATFSSPTTATSAAATTASLAALSPFAFMESAGATTAAATASSPLLSSLARSLSAVSLPEVIAGGLRAALLFAALLLASLLASLKDFFRKPEFLDTRFISGFSFELRTQLNNIISSTGLISRPELCPVSESQKEYVDIILNNSNQMNEFVRQHIEVDEPIPLNSLPNITFQLRTLLDGITGFSELLNQEKLGSISPQLKEFLSYITLSSREILRMTESLAGKAKIQERKVTLKSVDLFKPEVINTEDLSELSFNLHTSMNNIIGFTELMYHEKLGPISGPQKDFLNDMLSSTNEIIDSIKELENGKKLDEKELKALFFKIRTALYSIIGFTSLLNDEKFGNITSTYKEFLENILTSTNDLLSSINEINSRIASKTDAVPMVLPYY